MVSLEQFLSLGKIFQPYKATESIAFFMLRLLKINDSRRVSRVALFKLHKLFSSNLLDNPDFFPQFVVFIYDTYRNLVRSP